jgi:hypothetical protein
VAEEMKVGEATSDESVPPASEPAAEATSEPVAEEMRVEEATSDESAPPAPEAVVEARRSLCPRRQRWRRRRVT